MEMVVPDSDSALKGIRLESVNSGALAVEAVVEMVGFA